jgi:hypothetical protein
MTQPTVDDLLAGLYAGGHIGAARGINAVRLAARLDCSTRLLRELVTLAILDGAALCGTPRTGYFIAETAAECDPTHDFLYRRAMHSLRKLRAFRRTRRDLAGQLRFPT